MDYVTEIANCFLTFKSKSLNPKDTFIISDIKNIFKECGATYINVVYKHINNKYISYQEWSTLTKGLEEELYPEIVAKFEDSNLAGYAETLLNKRLKKVSELEVLLSL